MADFGVFVDLGGGVGFITVPNLTWRRIDHPSQVAHVGQEVVGAVLSVDLDREQASFSLKDLQRDPLLDFALTRFGSTVTGAVTKAAPVGVFVRLEEGIEGFLPVAEFKGHVSAPEAGDTLTVTVAYINVERRQVILSFAGAGTL
ncbi:S1 RNA-binding domain-containing protein [Streptomyces sp. LZ34]